MHIAARIKRKIGTLREAAVAKIALSGEGALALLYHRIATLPYDPQRLCVSPENFRDQLAHLKRTYRMLHPKEFIEIITAKRALPKRSCIITFDDGYADNVKEALPILEDAGVTAIFFIATGYVGGRREFWWDALEQIVLGKEVLGVPFLPLSVSSPVAGKRIEHRTIVSDKDRHYFYRDMIRLLKTLRPDERDSIIRDVAQSFGRELKTRESHRPMTEAELVSLSRSPSAVIGAHTVHHASLGVLTPKEQLEELSESKNTLQKITGKSVAAVAYPYGSAHDFNRETKIACRNAGFTLAFSNCPGKIKSHSDLFALPRIMVQNVEGAALSSSLPQ